LDRVNMYAPLTKFSIQKASIRIPIVMSSSRLREKLHMCHVKLPSVGEGLSQSSKHRLELLLFRNAYIKYIPWMSFEVWSRKEIGAAGEKVAAEFLRRKGFEVIEMNYLKPWGEIDIIAHKADVVRFIEVKSVSRESIQDISRESKDYRPEELVHEHKLRKVARTAEMYMNDKNDPRDYQIDVVGVFLDMAKKKAQCRLFEQVL
jgi:putative endonuclease